MTAHKKQYKLKRRFFNQLWPNIQHVNLLFRSSIELHRRQLSLKTSPANFKFRVRNKANKIISNFTAFLVIKLTNYHFQFLRICHHKSGNLTMLPPRPYLMLTRRMYSCNSFNFRSRVLLLIKQFLLKMSTFRVFIKIFVIWRQMNHHKIV